MYRVYGAGHAFQDHCFILLKRFRPSREKAVARRVLSRIMDAFPTSTACQVRGCAPVHWPPSAAQTARTVFPYAAFAKTQVRISAPASSRRLLSNLSSPLDNFLRSGHDYLAKFGSSCLLFWGVTKPRSVYKAIRTIYKADCFTEFLGRSIECLPEGVCAIGPTCWFAI